MRVLYISPLKALAYDVERNLRAPLAGIALAAQRLGGEPPRISIASRTGDTPADERRDLVRHPPDILVTTPESLYLLLTSQAREILAGVEQVIVDEVHAIAGTKRGAHLALSLERLERLRRTAAAARPGAAPRPLQRIGLSATQRPLETIARYLGGVGEGREVAIVDAGSRKPLQLQVVVPVEDMARLGEVLPLDEQPGGPVLGGESRSSIWPAIHPRILELIRAHRSTIVFVNSRRLAERLAQRLNELAGEDLVRAHHGSIAREQRLEIEEELKAGRLPALVATSSLELGIDMGAVDLVIQVESPTSVARGLQRIGRAGHQVGEPSKGVIFPKYRGDLLETAVVVRGMRDGRIEPTVLPRNPLDVLAQQLVAMTIEQRFTVDELLDLVRAAAPFETLTREALEGVLGMLAGAYPSDEFAELKPRITWDRLTRRRRGAAGRPDRRGHQRRHDPGPRPLPGVPRGRGRHARPARRRAGRGDGLRAARRDARRRRRPRAPRSWRVAGHQPQPGHGLARTRGPGQAAVLEGRLGRPAGGAGPGDRRVHARGGDGPGEGGEGSREGRRPPPDATTTSTTSPPRTCSPTSRTSARRRAPCPRTGGSSSSASATSWATGGSSSSRRSAGGCTRRGRWRSRRGSRSGSASRSRRSTPTTASRSACPRATSSLDGVEELLFPDPEEVEELVVGRVGPVQPVREPVPRERRAGPAPPAATARDAHAAVAAAPAGGGPARRGEPVRVASRSSSRRTASASPTCSTCPRCATSSAACSGGSSTVHSVETARASAFASSLLFDYVAAYMYEGDAPLAERRAQALTLDRDLLRELLGQEELRELLDPAALADLELSLQALADDRRAKTVDQVHDLLRRLGDLTADEAGARTVGGRVEASLHLAELAATRRAVRARIARRGALDRDGGRRAVPRRRGGQRAAGRAAGVPRAGRGGAGRAARPVRAHARAVPGRGAGAALGPPGRGRRRRAPPARGGGHAARAASSGRAARSASSATRRCSGSCAGGRSPRSGARWSPSIP